MNSFKLAKALAALSILSILGAVVSNQLGYGVRVNASWLVLTVLFAAWCRAEAQRVRKARRSLRPLKKNLHRIAVMRVPSKEETREYADAFLLAETGAVTSEGKLRVVK